MKVTVVGNIPIGLPGLPVIIAGPCVIESRDHVMNMADLIVKICRKAGFNLIFKTSFDKANRTSISSYRGPGIDEGLRILSDIKALHDVAVLTDIHLVGQIIPVADVVDMIQIPAFLCRQTDLYLEAGKTKKPVNIKKGQFLAPWDMKNVVEKAIESGVHSVTLTERGSCFGYNRLVVDFTGLPLMRDIGVPVIFDATHSVQLPGGGGTYTQGNRRFVEHLCRAAVAVGCDGLFLEVHDDPEHAKSDGPNMVPPGELQKILQDVKHISESLGR